MENVLKSMSLEELAMEFLRVLEKRNTMAEGGTIWENSDKVLEIINYEAMSRPGYQKVMKNFETIQGE